MSVIAYFIGGSMDLTKKILPRADPIHNFAQLPSFRMHNVIDPDVEVSCKVEHYARTAYVEHTGALEVWIYKFIDV